MNGFDVLKWMNQSQCITETPVIMISSEADVDTMRRAYELGITDYITRPFDSVIVKKRVQNTLGLYMNQKHLINVVYDQVYEKEENNNIIQYKNIKIDTISAKVYKYNQEIIFTSLEYRILLMLFTNQNKLITREQLLEKIWDIAGNFVNDNTLTVYIKRIREKLGDESIIKTVRGLGYRIGD